MKSIRLLLTTLALVLCVTTLAFADSGAQFGIQVVPQTATLIDEEGQEIGTAKYWNTRDNFMVELQVDDGWLVKVNCSALSESLLESELFGHVAGAFTGALKDKVGRFQRADGGTIFLDEIGDISPRMQLRLLRVIETMMFERVGDSAPVKTDVRIVAATNSDLRGRVATGEFREDLYYRLKVVQIDIPPLRQRRDDIPLLAEHFRRKFNAKLGRKTKGISSDVEQMFLNYPWPGNVRELENLMEHAFIRCRQDVITAHDLPGDFGSYFETHPISSILTEEAEAEAILRALEQTGGNKSGAARLLGMSRRTIYRKIEKHGITVGS